LARPLWDYFGGLDLANSYLDKVTGAYDRILVQASALELLAARYSGASWQRLTVSQQRRVNQLAADSLQPLRSAAEEYDQLIVPVLDAMMKQSSLPMPQSVESGHAACAPWQDASTPILQQLRLLQISFRRLFVEEQVDSRVTLDARQLLRGAARARDRLSSAISTTCAPSNNQN
jgi:hypothetical protein